MNKEKTKILHIDDDIITRKLFDSFLSDKGFSIIQAENGTAGLKHIQEEHIDLVILDLFMPDYDGLELLDIIRESNEFVPIIVVSGSGTVDDAVAALRRGAWDYLVKPIESLSFFTHTIERNLHRSNLQKENIKYHHHIEETLKKIKDDEIAARKIQMKLLPPQKKNFQGYTFDRTLIPSTYLSGDFVDYFQINESTIGFYSADVSGHGVSSALITMLLKSFVRKYLDQYTEQSIETILKPSLLIEKLNRELLQDNTGKHVIIFFGLLDTKTGKLTFVNGGQYPPPIITSEGHTKTITSKGKAVGLFPFAKFPYTTIQLPSAFRFIIFSDGILDYLEDESIDEKIDELKSIAENNQVDALLRKIQSAAEIPDDITLLTICKENTDE